MTPAGGTFPLVSMIVPLAVLIALPSRWQRWCWILLALPLGGLILMPLFEPIFVAGLFPAALAVLGPVVFVILDDREHSDTKRWPWFLLLGLLLLAFLWGISAASAHLSFKGDTDFCWASEISRSPCPRNPFLVAGAFFGYVSLPVVLLGTLPAFVTLVIYGIRCRPREAGSASGSPLA